MIIFVDSKNYVIVQTFRKDLPTKLIRTELSDLSTNTYRGKFHHELGFYYQEGLQRRMNLDDYSIIQCEKPNFLKLAIESNSFAAQYYMWLDIGYLRNNSIPINVIIKE